MAEEQSVELYDAFRAVANRARELRWPLFAAVRRRGSKEIEYFDACLSSQRLSEFLKESARFALSSVAPDWTPAYGPGTPAAFDYLSDPQLQEALLCCLALARDCLCLFSLAFLVEARLSSDGKYEHAGHAVVPADVFSFLQECFHIAMQASRPWEES